MRVLFISDLHCEDSEDQWDWLFEIIDREGAEVVLSAGDWGHCRYRLHEILGKVKVYTIYGNHDDVRYLASLRNVDGSKVLLDADWVVVGGLIVGGISGIIALKRRIKDGVPRVLPEEFIEKAKRLGYADILLLHEAPYIPSLFKVWRSVGSLKALEALRMIKPRILLQGHLHQGPVRIGVFEGITIVHVDSSVKSRGYAVLEIEGDKVSVLPCGGRCGEKAVVPIQAI